MATGNRVPEQFTTLAPVVKTPLTDTLNVPLSQQGLFSLYISNLPDFSMKFLILFPFSYQQNDFMSSYSRTYNT